MSVDTKIALSPGTQIADVADVIAILLGRPKTWTALLGHQQTNHNLPEPTDRGWTEVAGITYKTSDTQPQCCTINIPEIPEGWWFFYHFEFGHGGPGLIGGCRAERIYLHKRLVDFFGGAVDYNDSDRREVNYRKPAPSWLLRRADDKCFHALQLAKWNLQPMTKKEIARYEKYAAYKMERES